MNVRFCSVFYLAALLAAGCDRSSADTNSSSIESPNVPLAVAENLGLGNCVQIHFKGESQVIPPGSKQGLALELEGKFLVRRLSESKSAESSFFFQWREPKFALSGSNNQRATELEKALLNPVVGTYSRGVLKDIRAEKELSPEVANAWRSVLSSLQYAQGPRTSSWQSVDYDTTAQNKAS
ncbi:MAG: hypothetical protein MK135_14505 [Polyangiaceae bacterium]|nr:hypothetical protein [Polyangiaceae bacterium]